MPYAVEQKVIDPESELNNAKRLFTKLAPKCSVKWHERGEMQLVLPKKQAAMLENEMKECETVIRMSKCGLNGKIDANNHVECLRSIEEYEDLGFRLRDEKAQQSELDLLNYLSQKKINEIGQKILSPIEERNLIERHQSNLNRLNNRLEIATKRFCAVRHDNMELREEIQMLLVERENFNVQWNRTIWKLMKGKEYLMDILDIANQLFDDREKLCKKLDALKWKGLYQLNRDITEMQTWQCELSHATDVEQFLRIKGTERVLEAEAKEDVKRQAEALRTEIEIKRLDELLDDVFKYMGEDRVGMIVNRFHVREIENFSVFMVVCEVMQETVTLSKQLQLMRQAILDQYDINEARTDREQRNLTKLKQDLSTLRENNAKATERNMQIDSKMAWLMTGIEELIRLSNCDRNPLLRLLGNNTEVTRWNVGSYLSLLDEQIQALIAVEYTKPSPPPPRAPSMKLGPKTTSFAGVPKQQSRVIRELTYARLVPIPIWKLVPYNPCAYCVEDYIMHLVFETAATPADKEYIEGIFHLEDVNTRFGIYTLTVPEKRHPFRGGHSDRNTFV